MKIYLVGGAVRDQLLGLPVKEKDWVVVGATVDDMLRQGFRQVGKDFPVFLHPDTHEEYALARTERKVGLGYTGFTVDASPVVTLQDDLRRRDLTINAMAKSSEGEIIDPYGGQEDIKKALLRHVSLAFVEDPVRILRVARFAARFAGLGFRVASETNQLMSAMVASGEVSALVAERVWKELERALREKHPEQFFVVLADCGALPVLFPAIQIDRLGVDALRQAAKLEEIANSEVRFAVLLHDLSLQQIKTICERYKVPTAYRELALCVAQYYHDYIDALNLDAEALLALLQKLDAFRRTPRFKKFLQSCSVIAQILSKPAQTARLMQAWQAASTVNTKEVVNQSLTGQQIAEKIHHLRLHALNKLFP